MIKHHLRALGSLDDIAELRAARLASLTALPELFVEMAVRGSSVHIVESPDVVGYLTTLDGTLTELWVAPAHQAHSRAVLEQAAAKLRLRHAWACTFDPVALDACQAVSDRFEPVGISFRTLHHVDLPVPDSALRERVATSDDFDRVTAASHPEVFDDPADIPVWIGNGWVTLFEIGGAVAGFGLATPTGAHTPACDVGVRVCPPYQRRGLGAWIIQRMAMRAQAQGLIPTAGCGVGNTASRRTLERAGFAADHGLLRFDFPA